MFEAEDHDDHDGHHHGAVDPHAWLSPRNAAAWLEAIAGALTLADPDNAEVYARNASTASAALSALEDRIAGQLGPFAGAAFLTQHDGTQYFEAAFGLASRGAIASADGIAPGAARISQLRAAIEGDGIGCILAEPLEGRRVVAAVADAGPVRVAEIDLMAMGAEPGPALYAHLLGAIADAVADCLGGGGT